MWRRACGIFGAARRPGFGSGDFVRGVEWKRFSGGEGSRSLDLCLWCRGWQPGAEDYGGRRSLSKRRHLAENSFSAERSDFHAVVRRKGTAAPAAGERPCTGRHQRQGRIAGRGPLRRHAISERPEWGFVSAAVDLRRLNTPQELFQAAAEEVAGAATEAVKQRGQFTIALSGGSTPRNLYTLIAANAASALPWPKMFFFWGDERHVPPTDSESNYRMEQETLLSKVPIPPANVFRVPSENPDAEAVAESYEQTLRKF